MRILHLISQRPDSTGSGIYLKEILKQAELAGHENYLIASLPSKDLPPADLPIDPNHCFFIRFESNDLPFPITGMSNIMPYYSSRFDQLSEAEICAYKNSFKSKLKRILDKYDFDLIHSHHLWLLSSIARQLTNIPMVTSCHGSDLRQFKSFSSLRIDVLSGCQDIDHVFALSSEQKSDIETTYTIHNKNISVVGAGVNTDIFKPKKEYKENDKKNNFQIIYAGKLAKSKGVPYLLKAVESIIKEQNINIHIKLAGSSTSNEGDECLQLIKDLPENGSALGNISQSELAEQLQTADLFILPSLFEGLPLVILEALACNCPVLVTELPGVKEIVAKINSPDLHTIPMPGIIHIDQVQDEEAFIRSISSRIIDLMAKNTVKKEIAELSYFSWPHVFQRMENVYTIVCKDNDRHS
ncbi:MAG: glycosyltransferase family 4 protein [Desulfotalea sp.]